MAMRLAGRRDADPPFVVEKTPVDHKTGERDLARKREVYPDAWYLHIVRDREARGAVADARALDRRPLL